VIHRGSAGALLLPVAATVVWTVLLSARAAQMAAELYRWAQLDRFRRSNTGGQA
jgi:hypothetical protein